MINFEKVTFFWKSWKNPKTTIAGIIGAAGFITSIVGKMIGNKWVEIIGEIITGTLLVIMGYYAEDKKSDKISKK